MKLFFFTLFLIGCGNSDPFLFNSAGEDIGSYECFSHDEPWVSKVIFFVDDTRSSSLNLATTNKDRNTLIKLNTARYDTYSNIAIYPVENCENAPNFSEFEASTI